MSDILVNVTQNSETASFPAFVSRLRPGRFTSPSGVESFFLTDAVERGRPKKTAAHEITDSDNTVIQDMGSGLGVYPMDVYFVGENGDKEADSFYNSLYERYTPDTPGILNHPRWGDIAVIPFGDAGQTESLVSGSGVFRVTVTFRETKTNAFVNTSALSAQNIAGDVEAVKESALDRAEKMVGISKAAYSNFKASIRQKVAIVTGAIDGAVELTGDIAEEVEALTQDIYAAIDEGASPIVIFSQIQDLVTTVASVPSQTTDMVTAYIDMTQAILGSYESDIENARTTDDKQNLALSLQSIAPIVTSGVALSAINTDFKTRDEVGGAIDAMVDAYSDYLAALTVAVDSITGGVERVFSPDHDVTAGLYGVILDTQDMLLFRSFSLKNRRSYVLAYPTDPLTETWTRYGDLGELDFFCSTNKICGNEHIEIPAGRPLAYYA